MKIKRLGLVLISVGFLLGCGDKDLNKDFKPVEKDAPMPTAMGASSSGQQKAASTPP